MAAQKKVYLCRAPGEFKVRNAFTPQAAYTAAFHPDNSHVWLYTDEHTDRYAASEEGKRHYFVLVALPQGI